MNTEADLIAAHIARHGVTRCPAAIVAPTNVELGQADVEAHRKREAMVQKGSTFGWQPPPERRKGNRR